MGRLDKPKTFVVTGGLGFIGSHFVEKCLRLGHKVINFDKETYAANTNLTFEGDYQYEKIDICDVKDLPLCDVIVNFAAESHVDNSISENMSFINSNLLGVHNLLEIIKNQKITNLLKAWNYTPPLFLQVSTDEVFGDILEGAFKEDDRHCPSNPYSATKSAAEQLLQAWGRTYGIPWIISRTTNNYGSRQHPEKLISSAVTRLLKGEKVIVHGDGRYLRNWVHVEDHVDGIWKAIDEGEINNVYHFASEEELSVREIVTKICHHFEKPFDENVDMSTDRSGVDVRYALNFDKAKALGWTPTRTMDGTLAELISYYRNLVEDRGFKRVPINIEELSLAEN
jgi:dTDP-glucose 4,6-dehydratase